MRGVAGGREGVAGSREGVAGGREGALNSFSILKQRRREKPIAVESKGNIKEEVRSKSERESYLGRGFQRLAGRPESARDEQTLCFGEGPSWLFLCFALKQSRLFVLSD